METEQEKNYPSNKDLTGKEWRYDEDERLEGLDDICPYCGEEYDEIDWEYQICHLCKFNNND